jgi:hypothetical protein
MVILHVIIEVIPGKQQPAETTNLFPRELQVAGHYMHHQAFSVTPRILT